LSFQRAYGKTSGTLNINVISLAKTIRRARNELKTTGTVVVFSQLRSIVTANMRSELTAVLIEVFLKMRRVVWSLKQLCNKSTAKIVRFYRFFLFLIIMGSMKKRNFVCSNIFENYFTQCYSKVIFVNHEQISNNEFYEISIETNKLLLFLPS